MTTGQDNNLKAWFKPCSDGVSRWVYYEDDGREYVYVSGRRYYHGDEVHRESFVITWRLDEAPSE